MRFFPGSRTRQSGRHVGRRRKPHNRRSRTLKTERLEVRNLMAAGSYLTGTTLVVTADQGGGEVQIGQVGSQLRVQGPGRVAYYRASSVSQIRFYGSRNDDTFHNNTAVDSLMYGLAGDDELNGGKGRDTIYGGSGDDVITAGSGNTSRTVCGVGLVVGQGIRRYCNSVSIPTSNILRGGPGDDILVGGSGTDRMYGESGNDGLYGGGSKDFLYGGSGNDGLYGGAQRDVLYGGSGNDRFLRYNGGGEVRDGNWKQDAQINIHNGEMRWTDREVQEMDRAFAQLQERVGGSNWIFRDTLTSDPLVFQKVKTLGPNVSGVNSERSGIFNHSRKIQIVDWNENNSFTNNRRRKTIIHEIAHNWDGSDYLFASERNPFWRKYDKLHNRSSKPQDFARAYGATAAQEDWATMWETAFNYQFKPFNASNLFNKKLALVQRFLDQPHDWIEREYAKIFGHSYPVQQSAPPEVKVAPVARAPSPTASSLPTGFRSPLMFASQRFSVDSDVEVPALPSIGVNAATWSAHERTMVAEPELLERSHDSRKEPVGELLHRQAAENHARDLAGNWVPEGAAEDRADDRTPFDSDASAWRLEALLESVLEVS